MHDPSGFVERKPSGNLPSPQGSALTDVLAGLYNRRHAMDNLHPEWPRRIVTCIPWRY